MGSTNDGYFQIHSENEAHIFYAYCMNRDEWMRCIMKVIAGFNDQKIKEVKESLALNDDDSIQTAGDLNLQCVAYYIIDLEFVQSQSGNPQQLVLNQNFIISSIIWSYIHDKEEKEYEKMMTDLDEKQLLGAQYWLNWQGWRSHGFGYSRIRWIRDAWNGSAEKTKKLDRLNMPLAPTLALLPLAASAGAIIGATSTTPYYVKQLIGSTNDDQTPL